MARRKPKKYKPQKPLKIIKRVIEEIGKGDIDIYSYFGINEPPMSNREKIEFVYDKWERIEFRHDFIKALFGEVYPTGSLEEWMWCKECNNMTIHKESDGNHLEDNINMSNFGYCPRCGERTEYKVQKVMYTDIHIHRLRDTVAMPDKDQRLQHVWQMLDMKEENERITELLDKKVEELINKYNK